MTPRLPALLLGLLLVALPAGAQTPPTHVTTTKKSALAIGSGSFALVKGTKLEVVAREGDTLIVKFRSSQGKIPLADTDWPANAVPAAAPAPAPASVVPPVKLTPAVAHPAPAPAAKPAPPAAPDPAGKPTTNYGKAVQKAKQSAEAHKSTHVDPTKGIMDEEPRKN